MKTIGSELFMLTDAKMSGEHKTVIKGTSSKYVKLNVGGSLHYTTIGTLTKHDTMLRAMFSGRMEVLTDSEGNANGSKTVQPLSLLGTWPAMTIYRSGESRKIAIKVIVQMRDHA